MKDLQIFHLNNQTISQLAVFTVMLLKEKEKEDISEKLFKSFPILQMQYKIGSKKSLTNPLMEVIKPQMLVSSNWAALLETLRVLPSLKPSANFYLELEERMFVCSTFHWFQSLLQHIYSHHQSYL